jgi:uncharacterized cupredoxin-like copper-binding protein
MRTGPMRLLIPVAALAAFALVAAGCGGDNKKSSSSNTATTKPKTTATAPAGGGGAGAGGGLTESATDFKFGQPKPIAKSGPTTIKLVNKGQTSHAIELEGNGLKEAKSSTIGPGETTTLKVSLKPGKYEFYCPVDGHKQLGMKGELTVK